jgi:hypothetical protein
MNAAGNVPPPSAGVHAALDSSGAWKRKGGMNVSPLQPPPLPGSEPPSISKRARIDTSEMRMIEPPSAGMPTGMAIHHHHHHHHSSSPTQPGARLSGPTSASPSHGGASGAPTPTPGGSLRRKRPHNLSIDTAIGYGLQPHVQVHQQQLSALSSAGYSTGVSAMSARPPMSSALGSASGGAYGYDMVPQDHQHLIQRPRSDSKSKVIFLLVQVIMNVY